MQRLNGLAPEQAGFHDIGLFDRMQLAPALGRELEGDATDALDLRCRIDLRIDAAPGAVGQRFDAARLAEINPTGQLAHDHHVETAHQFRL